MSTALENSVSVIDQTFAQMPQGADTLPDGTFVCADVTTGELLSWSAEAGRKVIAKTTSGPIGLVMGSDGAAYLAHTGGRIGDFWLADDAIEPCIQRLELGATAATTILTEVDGQPLIAPHDISWGADGRLWFTDSHVWQWDVAARTDPGRIIALGADGVAEVVVETGATFPCGIVGTADGSIYWSESYADRIMRRDPDGVVSLYYQLPEGSVPHSIRFDTGGSLWVAAYGTSTMTVVAPDAQSHRVIPTGEISHPMSFSFSGSTLFGVDFWELPDDEMDGRLWSIDVENPGEPFVRGSLPLPTVIAEETN